MSNLRVIGQAFRGVGHVVAEDLANLGAVAVKCRDDYVARPVVRELDDQLRKVGLVCGDPVIWKPSEKTPLSALATMKILDRALKRFGPDAPQGLAQIVIGGADVGEALVSSKRVPIVSATGSTRMGSIVGPKVAARFGRRFCPY